MIYKAAAMATTATFRIFEWYGFCTICKTVTKTTTSRKIKIITPLRRPWKTDLKTMYILLTWQHVPSGQLYFWDLQCLISQIYIWIVLIFRGLLVQMAGQCAAASSCCQFPNFPDLRVRPSPRQPETGAVGCGWKLPTCCTGNYCTAATLHDAVALQFI